MPTVSRRSSDASETRAAPLLSRLQRTAPLPAEVLAKLQACADRVEAHPPRTLIQDEGEAVRPPRWLLSGWACRFRYLSDGRRLIFDVVLPGEGVGVCLRPKPIAHTSTLALTSVELADARSLLQPAVLEEFPALVEALQFSADEDERRLLAHVMRLGRMSALERTAHLLMELHRRLTEVGLAAGDRFRMPLTQEMLSDMLGLSVVHANRTLQELKRQELATIKGGWVDLNDPVGLSRLADLNV